MQNNDNFFVDAICSYCKNKLEAADQYGNRDCNNHSDVKVRFSPNGDDSNELHCVIYIFDLTDEKYAVLNFYKLYHGVLKAHIVVKKESYITEILNLYGHFDFEPEKAREKFKTMITFS